MPDLQTTAIESKVVFVSRTDSFTIRHVIDAAHSRSELQPRWEDLLRLVEAEKKADERDLEMDDAVIDTAAEQFRYEHDLITAEETEHWLEERGLTLSDFSDYFVRHYWEDKTDDLEPEALDYFSAPNELLELLTVELILSGELDRMAKRLSWRVAACRAESPTVDSKLIGDDSSMEATYRRICDALLTRQARAHEIAALRLPLTRFEVETIEFESLDAAREALLCVRDDGMSMEEVATEGRYPYRHTEVLLEDIPEDLQQKFLSVLPGEILEPISRGDGFHLCRIIDKAEPDVDDPTVRERAEKRILERHFEDLTAKYIQWRTLPA
jgi:hypothetical protein